MVGINPGTNMQHAGGSAVAKLIAATTLASSALAIWLDWPLATWLEPAPAGMTLNENANA